MYTMFRSDVDAIEVEIHSHFQCPRSPHSTVILHAVRNKSEFPVNNYRRSVNARTKGHVSTTTMSSRRSSVTINQVNVV
ncbi:hypothetical protein J6590_095274 [Homalodisca vitripennis]|nr:hypothetical protein J6590_095274 [Homalodisca vitripennis]